MTTLGGIDNYYNLKLLKQGRARLANRRQKKQNGAPRSRNARRKDGSPTNGSDMTRREAADYIATLVEELNLSPRPQDCR